MHPGKVTVTMDGVSMFLFELFVASIISALGSLGARERGADLRRVGTAAKRESVLSDSC